MLSNERASIFGGLLVIPFISHRHVGPSIRGMIHTSITAVIFRGITLGVEW